jgi:hypothetical protein
MVENVRGKKVIGEKFNLIKFLISIWILVFPFLHITTVEHNIIDDDCQVCSVVNLPEVNSDSGNNLNLNLERLIYINNFKENLFLKNIYFISVNLRSPPL